MQKYLKVKHLFCFLVELLANFRIEENILQTYAAETYL